MRATTPRRGRGRANVCLLTGWRNGDPTSVAAFPHAIEPTNIFNSPMADRKLPQQEADGKDVSVTDQRPHGTNGPGPQSIHVPLLPCSSIERLEIAGVPCSAEKKLLASAIYFIQLYKIDKCIPAFLGQLNDATDKLRKHVNKRDQPAK